MEKERFDKWHRASVAEMKENKPALTSGKKGFVWGKWNESVLQFCSLGERGSCSIYGVEECAQVCMS